MYAVMCTMSNLKGTLQTAPHLLHILLLLCRCQCVGEQISGLFSVLNKLYLQCTMQKSLQCVECTVIPLPV